MVRITCPWFSQARGESWLHRSHRYPGSSASCHEEITAPMEVVLRPLQIPTPRSPGYNTVPEDLADLLRGLRRSAWVWPPSDLTSRERPSLTRRRAQPMGLAGGRGGGRTDRKPQSPWVGV